MTKIQITENPNIKILNPKQYQNPKFKTFRALEFLYLNLFRISCLGFSICILLFFIAPLGVNAGIIIKAPDCLGNKYIEKILIDPPVTYMLRPW